MENMKESRFTLILVLILIVTIWFFPGEALSLYSTIAGWLISIVFEPTTRLLGG